MAKAKSGSKKETAPFIECENSITISGTVSKILCSTNKVCIMNIDSQKKTAKGNVAHTWVTVAEFSPEVEYEVGDMVKVEGYLNTDSYDKDGKKVYTLRVVADNIEVVDDVPFK